MLTDNYIELVELKMNTVKSLCILVIYSALLFAFLAPAHHVIEESNPKSECTQNCEKKIVHHLQGHDCIVETDPFQSRLIRYIPDDPYLKRVEKQAFFKQLAVNLEKEFTSLLGESSVNLISVSEENIQVSVSSSLSSSKHFIQGMRLTRLPYVLKQFKEEAPDSLHTALIRLFSREQSYILTLSPDKRELCKQSDPQSERKVLELVMKAQERHWKQFGSFRSCSGESCLSLTTSLPEESIKHLRAEVRPDGVTAIMTQQGFAPLKSKLVLKKDTLKDRFTSLNESHQKSS